MYVRAQALLYVKEIMVQEMSVHVFLYVCLHACFSKNKKDFMLGVGMSSVCLRGGVKATSMIRIDCIASPDRPLQHQRPS